MLCLWLVCPGFAFAATLAMTVAPLAAICRELATPEIHCLQVLPANISPHTYEPRPSDIKAVLSADALFYVGPLLDAWAVKLPSKARYSVLAWLPKAMRIHGEAHQHDDDHHQHRSANLAVTPAQSSGHDSDGLAHVDPHFWLDPLAVAAILPEMTKTICQLAPASCPAVKQRAEQFATALQALNNDLEAEAAPFKSRAFVVYHPFLAYMVKRYQLNLVGSFEPAPGREPTPKQLSATVASIKTLKARAIIMSPEVPKHAGLRVSEATGVPLHTLDDLGGGPGRLSYAALMRYNMRMLADALK